jgi:hypothetical protein
MTQIEILNVMYSIYLDTGKTDIEYVEPTTGLATRAWLLSIYIEPRNKHIQTVWRVETRANNVLVKTEQVSNTTSEPDFDDFENSLLGDMVKKSAVNGYFHYNLNNTVRIYNEMGELIEEQPVIDEEDN